MQWKPVVGWEGEYEVSDEGAVRSLDRVRVTARGSRRHKGKLLAQHRAPKGYYHVALSNGRGHSVAVHVLVAAAFIGPCPPGLEVCHRDGTRTNNAATNLRYGTRASNAADRKIHGTNGGPPPRFGEANQSAKLTEDLVREIRQSDETLAALGARLGLHLSTIHCVRARKTWRHI